MRKIIPLGLQSLKVGIGCSCCPLTLVHGRGVEQSGRAYKQSLNLKRIVAMMSHLHKRQACSPLLKCLAVDSKPKAACYGGKESLFPRATSHLHTLVYGFALVGKALGAKHTHPRMYNKFRQLHNCVAARRITIGSQQTAVVVEHILRNL